LSVCPITNAAEAEAVLDGYTSTIAYATETTVGLITVSRVDLPPPSAVVQRARYILSLRVTATDDHDVMKDETDARRQTGHSV
jgi:hypothetical protein